ncbi:FKBP-type peptidyl-prolyl cis-trans isomerase [Novipirellula artificiosorum]|uniref:Peptidyl-prolyl cis-trans isomerase n=1 Tax=Novipirellula artificiosorum TaxID=2528016 RepID=A0A5C6D969_9BACT|nr:FKBP-type peptidyl-prolyl cis-trans isomerase [Novipirellula artificiosorum]TWU33400.1 putative FKBP-type peptidyl-prolyl cis-trans isomerase [Novipirellula artificiosorum]
MKRFLIFLLLLVSGCGSNATGPNRIDPDAATEFTTTESGLKYRILRKSDGPKPKATDQVVVDYAGWLDDGSEFDSSYSRREPATFQLNGVVAGWTEGVQLIGEKGMIELEIPPELGYGDQGTGRIPPGATLHFKIELLDIR